MRVALFNERTNQAVATQVEIAATRRSRNRGLLGRDHLDAGSVASPYPLDKIDNILGRDEHADIALFSDMKVEKQHALIQRDGTRYLLLNNGSPADWTLVNDQPVLQMVELHAGDRIQLGNVVLRFQLRTAIPRPIDRGPGARRPRPADRHA